jgi:hypothetical protein
MKTEFDELREELESVDHWLTNLMQSPLPAKEAKLASSLQQYIRRCYHDKRKWRSELAARNARMKVKDAWILLFTLQAARQ